MRDCLETTYRFICIVIRMKHNCADFFAYDARLGALFQQAWKAGHGHEYVGHCMVVLVSWAQVTANLSKSRLPFQSVSCLDLNVSEGWTQVAWYWTRAETRHKDKVSIVLHHFGVLVPFISLTELKEGVIRWCRQTRIEKTCSLLAFSFHGSA